LWRRPRPKLGCGAKERRKKERKSRMRWAENVALIGAVRNVYTSEVSVENSQDHSEDLGMHVKIILKLISEK
jgi:hypothetical protein